MVDVVQFLPPPTMPAIDQAKLQANKTILGLTDGPDGGYLVYRELLESELAYMNQLSIFDQNDMNIFLASYDSLSENELQGFASKEQLKDIFTKLAELRSAQAGLLAVLQEPNPQLWATTYGNLAQKYQDYIELAGGLQFPAKVNQCLALLHPNKPFLSDTVIKPIQRGTKVELLMFDLIKKTPPKGQGFEVFYQSAISVNQSIQKGLVLREIRSERNHFESLIAQYNKKPKAEILMGIIGDLDKSSLTVADWKEYFSKISVAKLSKKELQSLKQLFDEHIKELSRRVENGPELLKNLKGKELTTQENDNRKNKNKLDNIQAMASFFAEKVEKEKPSFGKSTITPREVKVEPVEPRVAKEAFGDILIDFPNQDRSNRQAVKSQLREGLTNVLKQGALASKGYHVVETQKGMMGKTASFVLKDNNNVNLLQIVVTHDSVRIRELKTDALDADGKIALMHSLATALNITKSQAAVVSDDVDKVRKLNEISVNDGQKIYAQKSDEKKALHKKIELESAPDTVSKTIPAIKIQCAGNTSVQIKDKFQAVVADGSFVPQLEFQKNIPAPILDFTINITSEAPLVAIKQYEAALNAGMKPEFSPDAKKKVDSYVKKQMDSNHHDKQIGVSPVVGSTVVTGAQVLERLKQANQDGLLVSLDPAAQQVLRGHIAKGATGLDYEVPLKHPYVAVMVNQLLEMGITPDLNALSKTKKLDELRQLLREESKLNAGRITFIDSGNIERDLITIKTSFEELGNPVELNPKNIVEMLKHLKDKDLPILDLKNIPAKEQVFCAQRLAQLGIHTKFDAEVPSGQPIFIRSKNINHSKKMFEDYLNQGFLPVGNKQIRLLSERALPIKIQSTDPKVIWERMRHCAQSGLVVTLNDEQIKIMKQFSEKNNPQLPIHGYSWDTVKHNIELANQLGMGIRGVTNEAQAAYLRAQAAAKGNNMPRIDIVPIHKTESRFLRSDRIVDDRNRTTEFADSLFKAGINISMTGLSVMKADIENQATKTKWFGWSKTKTDNAKQAEQFLATQFAYMESKVKSLASEYNQTPAINLLAAADDLAPARLKKAKQPVAQIAPPVGEPVPLPPPVALKVPAPLPVTRPMAVTPSSTQQRANYAVNAAGQVTPVNINVKSRLTIQSVLEEITKLQKDLKGDLDIGSIKPAEFKEASDQLYSISSFLRQAEKDLAQGKASDASNLPQYLESIKSKPDAHHKVKEFLTKLVEGPQVQQHIPPRAPRM